MSGAVSDLSLRAADLDDAAAMADLIWRCDNTFLAWASDDWEPPEPDQARAKWDRRLRDGRHWTRLGFDSAGTLVAMVAWCPEDDEQPLEVAGGPSAYLRSVFVDPERWREGIGGGLVGMAEKAMRAGGYRGTYLWTPQRAEARRFYEAMGWRATAHERWEPDLDAMMVAYTKRLT